MANQRTTFGKRQREQNRNDKARAKQERLAARRASSTGQKGPPIAWDELVKVDGATGDVSSDASTETQTETETDTAPGDDTV